MLNERKKFLLKSFNYFTIGVLLPLSYGTFILSMSPYIDGIIDLIMNDNNIIIFIMCLYIGLVSLGRLVERIHAENKSKKSK